MTDSRPLPEFERPPVVELVRDVQFQPIAGLDVPRLWLLWQEFKDEFPNVQQQLPVPPLIERFGTAEASESDGEFVLSPFEVTLPRLWFLNDDGSQLVQIQDGRFIHNWRRVGADDSYPHYHRVRDRFAEGLGKFLSFIEKQGLGMPTPELCEITYFNHVQKGNTWQTHAQLDLVTSLWSPSFGPELGAGGELESASLGFQFLIKNGDGNAIGRWRLSAQPGYSRDGAQPIFVMVNTARGRPQGEGIEGVLNFLDIGHAWAVRGFAAVTTPGMQNQWGRKQ